MPKRATDFSPLMLIAWLIVPVFSGALAGTVAALLVTPLPAGPATPPITTTSTPPLPNGSATSTVEPSSPELIPLSYRSAVSLVPPAMLTRRASPVAELYRRARGATPEERTLTDERLLGQAVSLTSDGWFIASASVIGALPLTELTLWYGGKSYVVERGMADNLNQTIYVKVAASELPAPAFGDVSGLVTGAELWMERRSLSFVPALVTNLSDRMPVTDPASSETAVRRIRVHGTTENGDIGAPIWDLRGALVGIIDSAEGEPLSILPSTSLASSFTLLLSPTGNIRHARLGVRGVDMSAWKVDGARGDLPARGWLLRDDRKLGRPAVAKDSPGAKAGLKAGDVIISIERDILDGVSDLGEILSEYRPDAHVVLRVWRDGTEMNVPVTLGSLVTSEPMK